MPRYALLRHECPSEYKPSHWDLMLEVGGVLATWELRELPAAWANALHLNVIEAGAPGNVTRLPDHRLDYLDYEGPVTGGRGSVSRISGGSFQILESTPDTLTGVLSGETLSGEFKLTRVADSDFWNLDV
ncbi:DNA polymerase ligase N-terminal domain-containing protein [Bythopirellula goksoeyrii]|uniref:DNA ligase D 3'-phosphoesterase domain-containing protein n=1 Tax=Bythopirellula goksoeyrii TaxID=1400387 RepID=A0A5B9QBL4_9BACT|nr:DNA polymerase ligase N-terminal domain-containing protein [Bythopirellula goksoeyrii]QEG34902.1 hypothetical protein Pr1d_21900 [Bythopirellula goksoeyrii]